MHKVHEHAYVQYYQSKYFFDILLFELLQCHYKKSLCSHKQRNMLTFQSDDDLLKYFFKALITG